MALPLVFAHRGLPGRWQNSLHGVRRALELGYRGIEVDVGLTRDGVPVLSHDPWLHPELVRRGDGSPLGDDRVLLKDLSLHELRERYHFAVKHPDHPGEAGLHEGPCTLEAVVRAVGSRPGVALYLDLKLERPDLQLTRSASELAAALAPVLAGLDASHPVWIEAGSVEALGCLRSALEDRPERLLLSYPRFDADENDVLEVLGAALSQRLGPRRPAREAVAAEAQGVVLHWGTTTRAVIDHAHADGVPAVVFGVDDQEGLDEALSWPLAGVIVDHSAELDLSSRS